jgi:hypothetical protein
MAGGPLGTLVRRIGTPRRDRLAQQAVSLVDLFRRVGGFGARDGDEPVDVRVREIEDSAARRTSVAGTPGGARLAQEGLRHPERQSLFSNSRRADEKGHLGEPVGGDDVGQPDP